MLMLSSVDFFQNYLYQKILSGTLSVSIGLDPDQGRHSVSPDLGPNCLQKLLGEDKVHHYSKRNVYRRRPGPCNLLN